MGKPEDISQEAWDRAQAVMNWIDDFWADELSTSEEVEAHECIARAILSAKAEVYIEIAEMVDVFADTADFSAMNTESADEIAAFRIEEGALRGTSAAIRSRAGEN